MLMHSVTTSRLLPSARLPACQPASHPPGASSWLAGTVLDTESLVLEVARAVVERHGRQLTKVRDLAFPTG